MRVGPHGLLQPIADAVKLLIKEDIMPAEADPAVFWMAPIIVVITAFTVFIVVPFGPTHAVIAECAGHRDGGLGVELALPSDGRAAI